MPGFFGTPVLSSYTGPTADDAVKNLLYGQQQGFEQGREHLEDVQQGRDSEDDNPNPLSQAVGRIGRLFGGGGPSAPGGPSAADTARLQGVASDPSLADAASAASGAQGTGYTTRPAASSAVASPLTGASGMPRRPVAGEMMPQYARFATTADSQTYDRMKNAVAAGVPPAGLLATHADQQASPSVGAAAQQAGTPGAYHMPPISVTAQRPQAPAAAPAPAPQTASLTPGAPPGAAPSAADAFRAAMIPPSAAAGMAPNIPDFLAQQGVAANVSRPGLGTVSRAVPLLQPAYEAQAAAQRSIAEQNAALARTAITESGANLRSSNEIQGHHQDVATQTASQQDIAKLDRASQEKIAADRLAQEKIVREEEWDRWQQMFKLSQEKVQRDGVKDVVKGAQKEEDALTGIGDAVKVMELSKTNPSLMDGANVRAYMASNGIDSQRISEALQDLSDKAINPSVKAQVTNWLSGKGQGVNDPKVADAAIAALSAQRGVAYQRYDAKLRANAAGHAELDDPDSIIAARESFIAPDLARKGASGAPATSATSGGLRPVTQSEWDAIKKTHNLSDGQMAKYYSVGSPRG